MKKFLFVILYFLFFSTYGSTNQWEREIEEFFSKNKISFLTQFHYYTYLYVAQNDANTYDEGILTCMAVELAKNLFPHFTTSLDCVEGALEPAKEILAPYFARLNLEKMNPHTFPTLCWFEKNPENVEQIAHWIAWNEPLATVVPPPRANDYRAWNQQFAQLEMIKSQLTDYEIAAVHKWARGKGCCWYQLANAFMEEHQVALEKVLLVRALLMKGLYNGMIAEYEAKYTYCVPRPGRMDPTFKPLLFLDSPSYPSGHSIQATIAGTILSAFFPENNNYWQGLAEESADSRLWAGVHFPIDIEQGEILGRKIAKEVMSSIEDDTSFCQLDVEYQNN